MVLVLLDREDVPLLGERFLASYHFKVVDPKVQEATEKSVSEKSDPLTENFATKGFLRRLIHV